MRKVLCLLIMALVGTINAQVYPVQVNTQLIPPYSLRLSDYATAMGERLIVQAQMVDVNEVNRQLRFRLTIAGNGLTIRSNDFVVGAAPVFMDGGVPLRLSNVDLRPYFELRNLNGITPQQYNNPLPDGNYRFCFEVFDQISGQGLSGPDRGCFNAFLMINDPPLLNLPRRGDLVEAKNPQNILFDWTPRHLNANGVLYEFELREVWDVQVDPQAAFLAGPDLFHTTTQNTTLLYGPGETALLENRTYAWRVRAVVTDGISETSVFRNNGYSEIYHFTYTADCGAPQFALARSLSAGSEEITWMPSTGHLGYRVQYRKKGSAGAVWFETAAVNPNTTLYNLEPGTTYEYRVGGQCALNMAGTAPRYSYSAVQEFTTPTRARDNYYNCGIAPEVNITNREPLGAIGVNEVFTAGDFPVTVKWVEGSNGTFSGSGYIVVPYLADTKIAVVFTNIRINTDYQLVEGMVETGYDPSWSGVLDIGETVDQMNQLLENWTGTPEQIKELEEHKNVLTNELDNAITEAAQDAEIVAELEDIKDNLDTSTNTLINEGLNPTEDNVTAVKNVSQRVQEELREAETNNNIQPDNGNKPVAGDGYFDGVIDFTVAENSVQERPQDGPELVDLSQMLPENDDEEYVRITETALGNNKQLVVSTSNVADIDSNANIAEIKQRMALVGNMDYMLWIHYDLKVSQVKYKVAFGNNYYPNGLIAQNELVGLMNDALSFDLRGAIGSSIVALSTGLDTLLETYHDQLPQLDTEIMAGATAYELLKFGIGFARECGQGYTTQETGLVPRCLWDTENPLALQMAYYAGFIDGAWEIAAMGYDVAEFSGAWNPLSPIFHTSRGADIRQQTIDVLEHLHKLVKADDATEQVKAFIGDEVEKYIDETLSLDAQGRYNQGKLIFEVASAFFGVAEAKALLKTGKLTSNLLQGLASMPQNLSKLFSKLPGKLKKLQNNTLAYIVALNTYVEVARYTDDGVLIATKWVDEPMEVVESIREVIYKKGNDVTETTGEIGIVKDVDGEYGLGLVDETIEVIRGVLKSDFINSVSDFAIRPRLANEAWDLFKQERWSELEGLFKTNNTNFDSRINNVWPPNFGFKNITKKEKGSQLNGKIFDRFQKENLLGGSYASPILDNSVYSLPSRALGVNYDDLIDLGQNYYYFKFKIINATDDISITFGEAIPWFNEIGGATQVKVSKGFHNYIDNIEIIEKWEFNNGIWKQIK